MDGLGGMIGLGRGEGLLAAAGLRLRLRLLQGLLDGLGVAAGWTAGAG